jgi:4-hydroxy-3-methylbut-2-en-1-yl diphosphate synthase IspG/GcpE
MDNDDIENTEFRNDRWIHLRDCELRLCRPVGSHCPECGRIIFEMEKTVMQMPLEHGI